jgi:hypothetical protein
MIELFQRARWDQAFDYLAAGDPPMIFRLLAINTIFVIFYIIRKAKTEHKLRQSTVVQVQGLLVAANLLILFQRDIMRLLDRII